MRAASKLFELLVSFGFGHIEPRNFELLVAHVFQAFGYSAELTPPSGDDGVDVLLKAPQGDTAVVQCKRYAEGQYNTPAQVREFMGTMMLYNAANGYFVTLCSLSQQAAEYFSEERGIYLIDASGFGKLLMKAEGILHTPLSLTDRMKTPHELICETLN